MSLRFRKSFKIAPGVKLNLNKKSTSVTFGGKGFHHTISSSGRKTTSVGIPGTGLYYQDVSTSSKKTTGSSDTGSSSNQYDNNDNNYNGGDKKHHPILLWFLLLFIPPSGLIYLWTNKIQYSRRKRTILSAIFGFYAICWICAFIPGSGSDNSTSTTALVQEQTTTTVQPELQSTVSTTTAAIENTTAIIESSAETVTEPDIIVAQENESVAEPEVEPETEAVTEPETEPATERTTAEKLVWITATGNHYHSKKSCGNSKSSHQVPLSEAEARNLTPCQHCY